MLARAQCKCVPPPPRLFFPRPPGVRLCLSLSLSDPLLPPWQAASQRLLVATWPGVPPPPPPASQAGGGRGTTTTIAAAAQNSCVLYYLYCSSILAILAQRGKQQQKESVCASCYYASPFLAKVKRQSCCSPPDRTSFVWTRKNSCTHTLLGERL